MYNRTQGAFMSCKHYNFLLSPTHRYYIRSERHNNRLFCLIKEKGRMTKREISYYLDLTISQVTQLEKKALKKFPKNSIQFEFQND